MNHQLLFLITILLALTSCTCRPTTLSYQTQYAHLKESCPKRKPVQAVASAEASPAPNDNYLVILVDAPHLDYTDSRSLLQTLVKHPADGRKNSDVGHAWVYLHGFKEGREVVFEGGHSGELGVLQPKYFDGIMNYAEYGYANPTPEQQAAPRDEPDPIKYLWAVQRDGFFQRGAGHHKPTYAARIELTEEQFLAVLAYIDPSNYDYSEYILSGNQCSSFVAQVAWVAGLSLEHEVTVSINKAVKIGGSPITLWSDPYYSSLTLSTPDILEKSLMRAVAEWRALDVLDWYLSTHRKPLKQRLSETADAIRRAPSRLYRLWLMNSAIALE